MEDQINNEKFLKDYLTPTFYEQTKTILSQMENGVAKIYNSDGTKGRGFFCKIPLSKENNILALISNYHVIGESSEIETKTHSEKRTKKINLENKFKYSNPKHDITII